MPLFTRQELADFLKEPVRDGTTDLLITLTTGVIEAEIGTLPATPSAAVKTIGLRAAARAYLNPAGLVAENVDDYGWRASESGGTGVFLTTDERAALRRASGLFGVYSVPLGAL